MADLKAELYMQEMRKIYERWVCKLTEGEELTEKLDKIKASAVTQ